MDLFGRGKIMLNDCNLLVIDEADRMLDMGFIPDIEEICSKLPATRQTLLFSATMPPPIQKLASKFLKDPKRVEVARPATANVNIDQRLVEVKPADKRETLRKLLREEGVKTAIIFSNRKSTVRELTTSLKRARFAAGQIHGDMDQSDRIAELDRFKSGEINILVASDVAARGLDVKDVSHVFNFDVPWQPDDYIHRIGRTGRAGAKGVAITLATREDADQVAAIEKLLGQKIPRLGAKAAEPERKGEPKKQQERQAPPARAEQPKRTEERTPAKGEPAKRSERPKEPADADSGWNGPLPSFLSVSAS
jgi:superfamily II DNA/RNA helicase